MFNDLDEMDHSNIKKLTIYKNSIKIVFKSGNGLTAKGSEETIQELKNKMIKNLRDDQIEDKR